MLSRRSGVDVHTRKWIPLDSNLDVSVDESTRK